MRNSKNVNADPICEPYTGIKYNQLGRYYSKQPMKGKHWLLLRQIHAGFTDEIVETIHIPLIVKSFPISLRLIEWTLVNYAKSHKVVYPWVVDEKEILVNLEEVYKIWLREWRRKLFDPFRRWDRIYFTFKNLDYETTVAQLNFLKFALEWGVIEFAMKNKSSIEQEMNSNLKKSKTEREQCTRNGVKRKRTELSKTPTQTCTVCKYSVKIILDDEIDAESNTCE